MAPPPRPTPQNNVEGVVVARSEICSWEARNQFRDQHCLWKGGPANTKSSFSGGHTVKLTSSFPNGATTPTKTMLKVLSLRDRKMFLAKRGTDFAPSFFFCVWGGCWSSPLTLRGSLKQHLEFGRRNQAMTASCQTGPPRQVQGRV